MTISVKHSFISSIVDNPTDAAAGDVLPSHWNAEHTVDLSNITQNVVDPIGTDDAYHHTNQLLTTINSPNITNPNFTTIANTEISTTVNEGHYAYGVNNLSKLTVQNLSLNMERTGAVQGFIIGGTMNAYAMGDSSIGQFHHFFGNGPKNGDEGQAFSLYQNLQQHGRLQLATITSVARSGANTTLNGAITANKNPQTFAVVSSTGISVNDWIVLSHDIPSGGDELEAVLVTAKSGNNLTAVCLNNHLTGATVKPALKLGLDNAYQFGELRILVNNSGTTYSTGAFSSKSGGGVDFTGTALTNSIVGGDASNIGAISFDADTFAGSPFTGGGVNGPLRSWYQITQVTSGTHLAVHRFSTAGDAALTTQATPGAGTFKIRPAVRILKIVGLTIVCEPSVHTWTVADSVECSVCPYPDVTGYSYNVAIYTPGLNRRAFYNIQNSGPTAWDAGIRIARYGAVPTGAFDQHGWNYGVQLSNVKTGIRIDTVANTSDAAAMSIEDSTGFTTNWNRTAISWGGGGYIRSTCDQFGMELKTTTSGNGGVLRFVSPSASVNPDANISTVSYIGHAWLSGVGNNNPFLMFSKAQATYGLPANGFVKFQYTGNNATNLGAQQGLDVLIADSDGSLNRAGFSFTPPYSTPTNPGAGQGPIAIATSNITNSQSASFQQVTSVWNGSAAARRYVDLVAMPDQGTDNAHVNWVVRLQTALASLNYNTSFPVWAFAVRDDGQISFGNNNPGDGDVNYFTLDPSAATAHRTLTCPDVSGYLPTLSSAAAPISSTASGKKGEMRYASGVAYLCTADNVWVKWTVTTSF